MMPMSVVYYQICYNVRAIYVQDKAAKTQNVVTSVKSLRIAETKTAGLKQYLVTIKYFSPFF